eukprot:TRINITY_DN21825_c0_g1_i1.p2 TRINITY_DN21825_c0_g1~~TRINITY_DN21825_c0_g1_i1.p2  ORF type:complete len:151 (+),score=39.14 TRINITY_DN21825_c0_g1_i1:68-454(+)
MRRVARGPGAAACRGPRRLKSDGADDCPILQRRQPPAMVAAAFRLVPRPVVEVVHRVGRRAGLWRYLYIGGSPPRFMQHIAVAPIFLMQCRVAGRKAMIAAAGGALAALLAWAAWRTLLSARSGSSSE